MGMLVMAGKWANVLQECAFGGVPSPAADALFPVANLIDGVPGREFAFASAPLACNVIYDLDKLGTDGGFEAGTLGSLWLDQSTPNGVVAVVSTGTPNSGTYHAKLNSTASGTAMVTLVKEVKTGRRYRFQLKAKCPSGGSSMVKFIILNVESGKYLQVGGTWGASPVEISTASTTYVAIERNFAVEGFAALGGKDTCVLWIQIHGVTNVNADCYIDDARLWPEVDTVAIFGNNILPGQVPQVRFGNDATTFATWLGSLTPLRPAMYTTFATSTQRYLQVIFNPSAGSVEGNIRIGELWAGQAFVPPRAVSAVSGAPEVSVSRRQIVSDFQTFALSDYPVTSLNLPMHLLTGANYKDFRNEIIERSLGSRYPLVIVPDDVLEPDLVVMGKLPGAQAYRRIPVDQRETVLLVEGLPYATLVA